MMWSKRAVFAGNFPWWILVRVSDFYPLYGHKAQPGVTLTSLGPKFSRETIQVSGLPAGEYSVQIDGEQVAKATADQLAAGLELLTKKPLSTA